MNEPCIIWIIDDDRSIRFVLERALQKANLEVKTFSSAVQIMELLQQERPTVIVSDIRMPGMDGLDLLQKISRNYPQIPVIIMTAYSDLDSAVSAFHGGAFEYLPKPFDLDEAIDQVQRACRHGLQTNSPQINKPLEIKDAHTPEIIGIAPAMQEVFRAIGRLARSTIAVLISGESGTGKELVAHALHRHSPRATAPFIALNVAAIPKDLLESELFGHERGAFTGAQYRREGRFEQANGGTLFLDEIGDMPMELETRLLRVLAEGEFYRVGGHAPVKVDVRIIAASHQNLERLVQEGRFREDLFHRLNVIRIHLPALRDRKEDIHVLMRHFLQQAAQELGVETKKVLPETVEVLQNCSWPGNVRQLRNTALWLTVMASSQEIHPKDLPPELVEKNANPSSDINWRDTLRHWAKMSFQQGQVGLLDSSISDFESILIEVALEHTGGRKLEAAKLLGWGRNTLTRKIKELGLESSGIN